MLPSTGPRSCPPGVVLLLSVKGGDEARTAALLRSGVNPDETRDARGRTALHIAAIHGHAKIARLLVDAGASTETVTSGDCLTPLRLAVDNGHTLTAKALLDAGADMAARDLLDHATPLHAAAEAGHTPLVVELIRRGANLEARAFSGQTPLRWALSLGREGAATALLESGADPDAPDRRDACCLHAIAGVKLEEGIGSPCSPSGQAPAPCPSWSPAAMAELLLSAGADPNRGRRPNPPSSPDESVCYHWNGGAGGSDSGSGGRDNGSSAEGCVSAGERRGGQPSSAGETPLHVAARESSVQVAELLLRSGADPNAQTCAEEGGLSPLHCAAAPGGDGHRAIMQVLLKAGADVNAVSGDGVTTPLRLSCMNAAAGCVEELLQWGGDDVTSFRRPSPCLPASSLFSPSFSDRSSFLTATFSATPSSSSAGASAAAALAAAAAPAAVAIPTATAAAAGPSLDGIHSAPALPYTLPSVGNIETARGVLDSQMVRHTVHFHPTPCADPRLPPLEDVVGSRVPLSVKDSADCRRIRQMLRRMPLDRAWRRRGWLCMLYTRVTRPARLSCSSRGGFAVSTSMVASSAAFVGGEPEADPMEPLCTAYVKRDALVDGVFTRACSSKKTEPGLQGVFVPRGGLGAATSREPRKRRAPDATGNDNLSSIVPVRKRTKQVACCCPGVPNENITTNKLDSDNDQAKRPARTATRYLVARAKTEEIHTKTFRDLIGRVFEVQGDQSIIRKVIAWL